MPGWSRYPRPGLPQVAPFDVPEPNPRLPETPKDPPLPVPHPPHIPPPQIGPPIDVGPSTVGTPLVPLPPGWPPSPESEPPAWWPRDMPWPPPPDMLLGLNFRTYLWWLYWLWRLFGFGRSPTPTPPVQQPVKGRPTTHSPPHSGGASSTGTQQPPPKRADAVQVAIGERSRRLWSQEAGQIRSLAKKYHELRRSGQQTVTDEHGQHGIPLNEWLRKRLHRKQLDQNSADMFANIGATGFSDAEINNMMWAITEFHPNRLEQMIAHGISGH